ncbi:DUF1624 domain-containing protein [Candidatus Gracilibacteria bacterium]|nr:DUF1624 domain-containing protein [Candidatus Gracilibacteria bacterium]
MAFEFIPDAMAQTGVSYTDLEQLSLKDVVYLFAALAILGSGALAIVFIFFGGFSFILSGGDETKVKQAIHTIRYAIIGLVISLLSLVLVPLIGKLFGVNFSFLDFETLSNRINTLFDQFHEEDFTAITTTTVPITTPHPEVSIDELVK